MSDLTLHRRGKTWHVRGTVKVPGQKQGIRVRESAGTTRLKAAEDYRDKLRKEILEQINNGPAASATFSTAVVIYLEKGGEKRFMKPILARFGHTKIKDITADKVSAFALERYSHLAPQTIKRELYTPLNAALKKACTALRLPLVTFEAPKSVRTAVVNAPASWVPLFFQRAHFRIATAVLFLTTTGARVTELCNLVVEDFFPDQRKALLRKTKNGKPRMVPLDDITVRAMLALIEQDGTGPKDTLFGYSGRWSVNQAIERVCRPADKKGNPTGPWIDYYSSHKLGRHAFAARLLESGRTLKEVKDGGGWANIQIVDEIYGHLEKNPVHDVVRGTGSEVSGLLTGTSLTHSTNQQKRKKLKKPENTGERMVGTRGIEPLTPTMSREVSAECLPNENPENKVEIAE
jgi:integrase